MMPQGGQGNQGWNNQWVNQWPAVVGAFDALPNQPLPLIPLMGQNILAAQNTHYIPAANAPYQFHHQWQFNQQTNNMALNQSIIQNTQPPLPIFPPSSSIQQPNPPPPAKESTKPTATHDISEEERNFDIQFKEWEQKFTVWKEENKNHPDKKALAEYEAQWKGWREQLVEKRNAMRKDREESKKKELAPQSGSQKVDQLHMNKASGVPIKDPTPRLDYSNQSATNRSVLQQPSFSSDADTSHHQSADRRTENFNSRMNSSSNQHLQHEVYRDQPTLDSRANVHHPLVLSKPFPKDLNKSQQRDDLKPQPSMLNEYQHRPDFPFQPRPIQMGNNMRSHQLTDSNIPKDVKPLLSALSQDGICDVHQRFEPGLEKEFHPDAIADPILVLPPGETPASMFRKRAALGKIPLRQNVSPYISPVLQPKVGASSGLRIEERLAHHADIKLSALPLHKDSNARRSISPIVFDHSLQATVLEPIVFEYNHRPEKRNCTNPNMEKCNIIDYAHAKRARTEETLEAPPPTSAAIKPALKVFPEEKVEAIVPILATPEKKPIEASPVKAAAAPVQLFPSAAAIEEKELQFAKLQPKTLPNPVAEIIYSDTVLPHSQVPDTPKADSNVLDSETVFVEDILLPPGRYGRPSKIVVIIRGLPGSGKSHLARLIKEKEVEAGGSAPRILSIDDYFLMDDGSPTPWQEDLEQQYFQNLLKSLKRNLEEGHFPFIIVDALHIRASEVLDVANIARSRAFAVFLIDLPDKGTLTETTRKCSEKEVEKMKSDWENAPKELPSLDIKWLQETVDKDDPAPEDVVTSTTALFDEDSTGSSNGNPAVSKWEMMEQTGEKLDRLDGITKRKSMDNPASMEDWLQSGLPDDYDQRKCAQGKKRVRWADVEEKVQQRKMRDLGFVVGQTDWNRMIDPSNGESALTKTKYI